MSRQQRFKELTWLQSQICWFTRLLYRGRASWSPALFLSLFGWDGTWAIPVGKLGCCSCRSNGIQQGTTTNRIHAHKQGIKKAIRGRDSAFKNNLASGKTGNAAEKSSCCRWRLRDTGQLRGALCCGGSDAAWWGRSVGSATKSVSLASRNFQSPALYFTQKHRN